MLKREIPKNYEPTKVEKKWYEYWLKKDYFNPDKVNKDGEPFCIVIPPPNVTGQLHMGHALNNTLQDILTRWKRMKGYKTLWLPGTDHAGIATQNVVEKSLLKEGIKREDLGREKFLEKVWEWKEKYGNKIIEQLKQLGASCDWTRTRFTMDKGLSNAVKTVFVKLYNEGLIYRGNYIINWCPRCKTALSDVEIDHKPTQGKLYYIKYYFENSNEYLVIATTRPETMLGDTAVAVHPDDERYKHLENKYLILPLVNRRIPLIKDNYVDPKFGTGALKITPAHDPNDFLIGKKHNLEEINIFNEDATTNENAGEKYKNLDRFVVREIVIKDLEAGNYLLKVENYEHNVGHCYRCNTIIEPYISRQWFVKMKPLAEAAIKAVEEGRTKFHPENWAKTYFEWMRNVRDWCISRQIWWGHQIPAWYCKKCGYEIVSLETPNICPACQSTELEQDDDVLDTWFSSALWPFSTLGWPDETDDLKTFYPTSVLSTAFDIIYFWVARMMIMGLHFMKDVPFRDVYIHALIRTETGEKMSKSSGNIIDPIDIINKFGCDALRFTLAALAAQGRDIRISENIIEGYKHFINKIWNSFRFIFSNISEEELNQLKNYELKYDDLALAEKWIIYNMNNLIDEVDNALTAYKFNEAAYSIYSFLWHKFCDWFIEISKLNIYSNNNEARQKTLFILIYIFKNVLKFLQPFAPFIAEELYHYLPEKENTQRKQINITKETDSIIIAKWPEKIFEINKDEISDMDFIIQLITGIRNLRQEFNIPPNIETNFSFYSAKEKLKELVKQNLIIIETLSKSKLKELLKSDTKISQAGVFVSEKFTIYLHLKDSINIENERKRLEQNLEKIMKEIEQLEKKLQNKDFINKAKKEVIEKARKKYEELKSAKIKIEKLIKDLK
ncbi:MAG TPA: valine--tRNA ligase [bacterium]|nr:valine--tRNA ligase [bacterium]HOL46736.1 valine--tRNA ligase [bacterium]HPQ18172.1 valine--tRNA ligase [bacterium]